MLPALGSMRFDTDDLSSLEAQGLLDEVIKHEMGHVLGIGTLWGAGQLGLTVDPTSVGGPLMDTYFQGAAAIEAFDRIGGTTYNLGAKVPLENDFVTFPSLGSLNTHWREGVFTNELMTPSINNGANPVSIVSIAPTIIHRPHATSRTPVALLMRFPAGDTFSTRTNAASAAIHRRFMTPSTKSSAISTQQQPRQ